MICWSPPHRSALLAIPLAAMAASIGCDEDDASLPQPTPVVAPPWFAEFERADRQYVFVNVLRQYFHERGETATLTADGRLEVRSPNGTTQEFVVAGLAEAASRRPSEEWPELVNSHFEGIAALRDAVGEVEVPDWETARPRLRLRIYPESFLTGAGLAPSEVVAESDLPGTLTVLVVDSADTALVVPREDLKRWGQRATDAMGLALVNTKRALEDEIEVVSRDFPEIGAMRVVTGDSFYSATAVLWLQEFEGLLGEHGAIVGVPWRHGAFVYPFDDARVQTAVPAMYRYMQRIVEGGVGPIDAQLWWRRPDGRFLPIRIREVEGRLEIEPPREMAEILARMK